MMWSTLWCHRTRYILFGIRLVVCIHNWVSLKNKFYSIEPECECHALFSFSLVLLFICHGVPISFSYSALPHSVWAMRRAHHSFVDCVLFQLVVVFNFRFSQTTSKLPCFVLFFIFRTIWLRQHLSFDVDSIKYVLRLQSRKENFKRKRTAHFSFNFINF